MEERTSSSIDLWPDAAPQGDPAETFKPFMEPYLLDTDQPRGAVLVCPGGGYGNRADHEGSPVAKAFNERGFHAFVVQYRITPNYYPAPQLDLARAIRIVRSKAAQWNIIPDCISVCGFSAGGHLAGSLGVMHKREDLYDPFDLTDISCRPDSLILAYPVISCGEFGHQGSFNNLYGQDADISIKKTGSLELLVDADTPPSFLWHTSEDAGVPPQNSMLFADQLNCNGIPFELHVFPHGRHGIGLAEEVPRAAVWIDLAADWLKERGF